MKQRLLRIWLPAGLAAAAVLVAALALYLLVGRDEPVVYVSGDALCVYDGKRSRVVQQGYNSSALTSSTQLSKNGKHLFYIAPAGASGTLYRADASKKGEGAGDILARNATDLSISPSGRQVVYQTAELDLYGLAQSAPRKLDSSVREVLGVSDDAVLYSKYSKGETGQALYLCSLKKDGRPVLVSEEFEAVVKTDASLSTIYYQTRTPDLGSDPSCHNLYLYHPSRKGNELLLRNVARIYQVDPGGEVLFSIQGEGGLTLESVLTDPFAAADQALKSPEPGSDGYEQALRAYQEKQLRDTARTALKAQLERAVKLDVFYCKPSDFTATRPAASYIGEVELLEQGEKGAFFAVTDWSGVKLAIEDIITPETRKAAIDRQTAVSFCGVTVGGADVNLCKTANGLFRKDAFGVDWNSRKVYFLAYTGEKDSTGALYEASFGDKEISESRKKAENVAAVCPNGLCMEMEQQEKRGLYSADGVPILFDNTLVPETPVQLIAHTGHCCAAFFKNEDKKKEYTFYSVRAGKASLVSEWAAGELYFRGKNEFLFLEKVDEATGQGNLVLCRPHRSGFQNIQLDTGVSDVLVDKSQKKSLTTE